jgi:selenocysteine lyase/cysteine desulfurase
LMQEIGIAETREHVLAVNAYLLDGLDELGAKVITPRAPERRGALLCVKSTDANEFVSVLDREGIVTSERDGNLRISAHCYNTREDVDVVLAALRRHRELLA